MPIGGSSFKLVALELAWDLFGLAESRLGFFLKFKKQQNNCFNQRKVGFKDGLQIKAPIYNHDNSKDIKIRIKKV